MKYKVREIKNWNADTPIKVSYLGEIEEWIPTRPVSPKGLYPLLHRAVCAWGVLIGRFDALDWEEITDE